MVVNGTCVFGNNTWTCLDSGSASGAPAWPAVFVLLLLIPAGVVVYKYRSKIRRTFQSVPRGSLKKEEGSEAPAADSHPYIHVRGQRSTKQMPIYENLATQKAKGNASHVNQRGPPSRHEEDLYLQCDFSDDAIYSNDPACNLSILAEPSEDLYILPDA